MSIETASPDAVRGCYRALGVQLPAWAGANASCRCFANPEGHNHDDRNPSCSVSMESGAFRCWGCGAEGGAFDAAIALGLNERQAMDLLIEHHLAERRPTGGPTGGASPGHHRPPRRKASADTGIALQATEHDVVQWCQTLAEQPWPFPSLRGQHRRLWTREALTGLECGWERHRVTFPIRNEDGGLQGVIRYASRHDRTPKALAVLGTRLGPIPHPAALASRIIVCVEGLPDLVAARAQCLPAVGIPGTDAWDASWAKLFAGRIVITIMDCDTEGRRLAARMRQDLAIEQVTVRSLDLAPDRDDSFDLCDWLDDHPDQRGQQLRARILNRARLPSEQRTAPRPVSAPATAHDARRHSQRV